MDRPLRPRKPDPMFLGVPSPSLRKMQRMSVQELQQQVERLTMEGKRLLEKAERLKTITPLPQDRIEQLNKQKLRLDALAKVAQNELVQRQQQGASDRGHGRPGGRGSYGSGRGYGSSRGGYGGGGGSAGGRGYGRSGHGSSSGGGSGDRGGYRSSSYGSSSGPRPSSGSGGSPGSGGLANPIPPSSTSDPAVPPPDRGESHPDQSKTSE